MWQLLASGLVAQTTILRLEALDIQDAPPLATIDCIYEDSRGFVWFGAYSGLYRFDGYHLTHFKYDPNDSLSISDNKIKKILEDEQGNFWVGTQVGLNYFDVRKRTFKRYISKQQYGIDRIEIYDIKQDKEGNTWVAAADGLYRLASAASKFERYFPSVQDSVEILPVYAIELSEQGVFICSPAGLFYQDFSSKKVTAIASPQTAYIQLKNGRMTMQKDRLGTIWIGSALGLFYYDPSSANVVAAHPAFKNEAINYFGQGGARDVYWIATDSGLSILSTRTRQCTKNVSLQINGEKNQAISFSQGFYGSSGIAWLSSTGQQLYVADQRKERFRHAPIRLSEYVKGARQLFELYEYSPGVLLVPRKGTPSLLNIYTQNSVPFPFQPDYNLSGWKTGMTCFMEERNGHLWIGTGGGLFLFDKGARHFIDIEKQFAAFKGLRGLPVRSIHRDRKNNLWVATWNKGIFKFNMDTQKWRQYNHSEAADVLNTSNTRSVLEARDGTIWVGTRGGLLKYLEAADSFQVYKNVPGDPETMSENTAFCIYEDASGNIWCGTYGGGLNKLDVRTGKFKHYTTEEGLLNNNVFSLIPDKRGNLWLSGFNGISRFNPSNDSFHIFTQDHGLLSEEYDAFLHGQSRYSDRLFFCGKYGIDHFDPDSVQLSTHDPNILITNFRLFNEPVPIARNGNASNQFFLNEDISFTSHLKLRYDQNVITFDYVALDFSSPATIQYAYKLVGFDKDWQYVGNRRSVTFTNLDPGNYTFQVKATNGDGVWGSKMATLAITVLPPWWRTWWFLSLVFLSVAALVIAFYRYRIRQIKEREAINQRITEVKMEALRSQMNPHFIFNCLSSLKSYAENGESDKASAHISKFAKLLRQVLEQSKSDSIGLAEELDTLQRYVELEQMRYKNFDFQIDLQSDVLEQDIKIPPLIVQPYIENAIWHGLKHKKTGNGRLLLQVNVQAGECRIIVEDNGIGRAASQKIRENNHTAHQSHGLNVTAERMALFSLKYGNNARVEILDLTDSTGAATGTRVILSFKIQQFDET